MEQMRESGYGQKTRRDVGWRRHSVLRSSGATDDIEGRSRLASVCDPTPLILQTLLMIESTVMCVRCPDSFLSSFTLPSALSTMPPAPGGRCTSDTVRYSSVLFPMFETLHNVCARRETFTPLCNILSSHLTSIQKHIPEML